MATLREMIEFTLELESLSFFDSGHEHRWDTDINPFVYPEREAATDTEARCRLQRFVTQIAARMHFGHDAYFGDRWRGFSLAELLLLRYDDFDPDPCDAGDVIDWLAVTWDSNPATLFRDLQQAFPALEPADLGRILSAFNEDLQENLWEAAYDNMSAAGRVRVQGIDPRADALDAACRTCEPGTFPEDYRAHLAEHAAQGHIVAAYHLREHSHYANAC